MSEVYFIGALITACVSAFCILLLDKNGWRAWIIANSPVKLVSDMFGCDFCLSFWLSFIPAAILALLTGDLGLIVIPLISTPITRILL